MPNRVNAPNLVEIGQTVAKISQFNCFWNCPPPRPPCSIFKIVILNVLRQKECQCALRCQISTKSVKWLRRYCDFVLFWNGGGRHLGFSKIQIFKRWCIWEPKLPHCVKFRQDRSICCCDMAIFLFFKMAAVLDFQKFNFLTADTLRRRSLRIPA